MTPRRGTAKRKRKRLTAHRRAIADPNIAKLVAGLRKRWKAIDGIERGDCLRELAVLGCSTRGLGKKLRQSATTIRRHMELAGLPIAQRRAVKAGASAKKILSDKAILDRQRRRKKRIDDDRKTGALSDEVADIILEFCRGGEDPPRASISRADFKVFINSVALLLFQFEARGQRSIKTSRKMGVVGLFEQTRSPVSEETFWLGAQAEWLAHIVWANAQERPIWESSLIKAERRVAELDGKGTRTPLEVFSDNRARRADIGNGPGIRPHFPGGAYRMTRQGRGPVS